jgi:hypothetical protein
VGGRGVNVGIGVTGLIGASESPLGWKGVGVGNAFGFAVTITRVGGAEFAVGKEQAARNIQNANRRM